MQRFAFFFFLLMLCGIGTARGEESVFKVLTADELRNTSLRQSPDLLRFAARAGETVRIEIRAAEQGAVIQEDVTAILDCGPWLSKFPGGSVNWYRYAYVDYDHTQLSGVRMWKVPERVNSATVKRNTITGDFNEIFTIIKSLMSVDAEDSSRGVYECEVCFGNESQICNSANTTIAIVGRPPIIDSGTGRAPFVNDANHTEMYNVGSTICLDIHSSDPTRNRPISSAQIVCGDVGKVEEKNIPNVVPRPLVTWRHTSVDGVSAFFAINQDLDVVDDNGYTPPIEFQQAFPGLVGTLSRFRVSNNADEDTSVLDFSTMNATSSSSDYNYLNLRRVFGLWECTLSNSLGSETEITFISDSCITVGLEQTMYSVSESEGMVQICINAEGVTIPCSITHPFQVILSSSHESAVNSTAADYEAVNETVTFSPCENRQCVNVNINGLIDEEEWVSLSLTKSLTTPSFIALNQDLTTALMFITNESIPATEAAAERETETAAIVASAVGVSLMVTCTLVVCTIWRTRKCRRKQGPMQQGHELAAEFLETSPSPPPPPQPLDLVQQLQEELGRKNMLYYKHHIHLSKVIGEGESGLVYRGYINSGELVAVKTGKALLTEVNKERLLKEVTMMLSFDHPNVMSLKGMCFDGEVPLLIMPLMSGGSVLDYVTQNRESLHFTHGSPENEVSNARKKCLGMCHQIVKGMSYLATHRFVHRDLAARNCMIDSLNGGLIKVGDFGLAEDMYGTNYYRHERSEGGERVPIRWMAPESINTNIYNQATDVWSFGVTCWEVFTCGSVPYTGVPAMTLLSELHSGHRLERPSNAACSDTIWEIMRSCWLADRRQRPKFSNLVGRLHNLLDSDSSYLRL